MTIGTETCLTVASAHEKLEAADLMREVVSK
jgi:hypothetical protein